MLQPYTQVFLGYANFYQNSSRITQRSCYLSVNIDNCLVLSARNAYTRFMARMVWAMVDVFLIIFLVLLKLDEI